MDRKAKKRIDVLQKKLQTLRQQLAGEKRQQDNPAAVISLQQQIRQIEAELAQLKGTASGPGRDD